MAAGNGGMQVMFFPVHGHCSMVKHAYQEDSVVFEFLLQHEAPTEALSWKPSSEATDRLRGGYPINEKVRGLHAPQDKLGTRLPRMDGKNSSSSPTLRKLKDQSGPASHAAGSPAGHAANSRSQDHVTECLRMQYAAILQIAEAVRARPPPHTAPARDAPPSRLPSTATAPAPRVRSYAEFIRRSFALHSITHFLVRRLLGPAGDPPSPTGQPANQPAENPKM